MGTNLKQVFNMTTRLHSRAAVLKRPGTPNLYTPIRITPSNYFRFLSGPSTVVIRGREFIIPLDSMLGVEHQTISFSDIPTIGTYSIVYGDDVPVVLDFDAVAADVLVAIKSFSPTALASVTCTGDNTTGFVVTFIDVQSPSLLTATPIDLDVDLTMSVTQGYTPWTIAIKRGDKIVDSVLGHMAIDEIVEVVDLGGAIMGFRVRSE